MNDDYRNFRFVKATFSKHSTNLAFYEYPKGDVIKGKGGRRISEKDSNPEAYCLRKSKNDATTLNRRFKKIHELMRNNFCPDNCIFVTLTYDPAELEKRCFHSYTAKHTSQEWFSLSHDAQDDFTLKVVKTDFQNFIRTLKYYYDGIAYLGVIEQQENGSPHIHFVINILDEELLQEKWTFGLTDARFTFNIGGLAKYFCKQMKHSRPRAHAVLNSRNLQTSVSVSNWNSETDYITVRNAIKQLHQQTPDRIHSCYNLITRGLVYETYYKENDTFQYLPVATPKQTASPSQPVPYTTQTS